MSDNKRSIDAGTGQASNKAWEHEKGNKAPCYRKPAKARVPVLQVEVISNPTSKASFLGHVESSTKSPGIPIRTKKLLQKVGLGWTKQVDVSTCWLARAKLWEGAEGLIGPRFLGLSLPQNHFKACDYGPGWRSKSCAHWTDTHVFI